LSEIRFPLIIVNFKAYPEVEGEGAISLARACADVAEASGVSIVACPPTVELSRVASSVKVPVMAQHVDSRPPGSSTGWITAGMVRRAGAIGTLVNHSEHRLGLDDIRSVLQEGRITHLHLRGQRLLLWRSGPLRPGYGGGGASGAHRGRYQCYER
jgi:triosephosphate isomerase